MSSRRVGEDFKLAPIHLWTRDLQAKNASAESAKRIIYRAGIDRGTVRISWLDHESTIADGEPSAMVKFGLDWRGN